MIHINVKTSATEVQILSPNGDLQQIFSQTPLVAFSPLVLNFIDELSVLLRNDPQVKASPELLALGYWLRRSNIKLLKTRVAADLHKALGVVLHITPNNVDSMFMYSWVCSLLMGNSNIVRLSESLSETKITMLALLKVLFSKSEFQGIASRNLFVTYQRDLNIANELSLAVQGRVIWGGDDTVNHIRMLPCQPRCRDISFADRYSACVIQGDALSIDTLPQLATLLWRDTHPHNQLACSSPRLIYWLGETKWQMELFSQINQLAMQRGQAIHSLNNLLVTSQLLQSTGLAAKPLIQQAISVVPVDDFVENWLEWHTGDGCFLLLTRGELTELAPYCSPKLQTLSYWGLEQQALVKFVQDPSIQGIDRLVPVGQALDFSPRWDGYNLLTMLARTIEIK